MLVRADREIGTYLKDAFELLNRPASAIHGYAGCNPSPLYRGTSASLPREISFTLKAGRGNLDHQEASKIKELLPRTNGSLVKMEDIAKACISIWGMLKFFDERRLVEELCRENNIRRVDREPCTPFPLKNIPNLNVGFLKRAAADRAREESKQMQGAAELTYQEPLYRGQQIISSREDSMFDYDQLQKDNIVHAVGTADPIRELDNHFEQLLISDIIAFHEKYPNHKSIGLSSTYRSVEKQAGILTNKLFQYNAEKKKTDLQALYGHGKRQALFDLLGVLALRKMSQGEAWHSDAPQDNSLKGPLSPELDALLHRHFGGNYSRLSADTAHEFFVELTIDSLKEPSKQIYKIPPTSDHMKGNAVDISPSNSHEAKKELVEFLNSLGKYKMFLYLNDKATYTAEKGEYRLYGAEPNKLENKRQKEDVFKNLEQDNSWYFHVQ